jgi:hypothetical protein
MHRVLGQYVPAGVRSESFPSRTVSFPIPQDPSAARQTSPRQPSQGDPRFRFQGRVRVSYLLLAGRHIRNLSLLVFIEPALAPSDCKFIDFSFKVSRIAGKTFWSER